MEDGAIAWRQASIQSQIFFKVPRSCERGRGGMFIGNSIRHTSGLFRLGVRQIGFLAVRARAFGLVPSSGF